MDEAQGQQEPQEQEAQQPGYVAAGSPEDQYAAQVSEIVARYPDLADPEYANAALATAHHFAHEFGDPTLAGHPALIEASYVLNQQAAAEEEARQAAQPVDRAQEILDAGGAGRKVLPF